MNWDGKEQEKVKEMITYFIRFSAKRTCPMCNTVKKFEEQLDSKTARFLYGHTYKERIHDNWDCFYDDCWWQILVRTKGELPPSGKIYDMVSSIWDKMFDLIEEKVDFKRTLRGDP